MTVIVALPDRMLSDSICTNGDVNFPSVKIYRYKGALVGCAGNVPSIEKFLRWYMGPRKKPIQLEDSDSFAAVVVDKRGIWDYGNSSLPDKVLRDYHGIGVGWPAAHAAMLAGASAHRAIEISCQVTHLCGLPVQEFKV